MRPRTVAELQRAEVIVESGGARAGTLTASGRWPLAAAGTTTPAGAMSVSTRNGTVNPSWNSSAYCQVAGPVLCD